MNEQRCACAHCSCTVDDTALVRDGKAYCCEACAFGHRDGQPCRMGDCKCADTSHPEEGLAHRST
ncbi:metallothionein [Pseudomonas sp. KU43P]|uniref:metallothionein n=1 Tax=Pseudomonas sp. KU43P TaxID=2487887 RepID=UPI002954FDD7|nr:metallothionein [Pseudomonas sp. KU43P]